MQRLIDANKLIAKWKPVVKRYEGDSKYWETAYILEGVIEDVENEPTVDAVRHGHWIKANDPNSSPFDTVKRCLCSECREWGRVTSYCPNCGAKMDEEEEDAETN